MSSIYEDPTINEACKYWVEWRKEYCSPSVLRSSHVAKTLFQQLNELRDNIESLKVFYTEICINNRLHFFTNVYASLRSLLYWPDNLDKKKKQNYKPLLYRLANSLELPLPVYANPILLKSSDLNDGSLPIGIVSAQNNPMASTTNKFPQYIIIDIQEWLNRVIFADSDGLEYSLKKLLFDSANSWGAHSDEDIPEKLDMLRQTTIMSNPITHSLILNILEIVISLGIVILSKHQQQVFKPMR